MSEVAQVGAPERATARPRTPDHADRPDASDRPDAPDQPAPGRSRAVPALLALAGYLALSLVLWWHVWGSAHPSTTTICGCGDPALFLWFIEWPAYALGHGQSLVHSSALFHPVGINLLSNTSELAVGTVLAPVTWLFGPVTTLNVASTVAPVASALAMFWLIRRWVDWTPAAFVGGLLYGFSPFMVVALSGAYLMETMLFVPPLLVIGVDELLVRQRRSAWVAGPAVGLLVVVQFFLGTEMLVITSVIGALAVLLVVLHGALTDPAGLRRRAPHAWRGLGLAAGVTVVLLAYPAWFALAGPAHLAGHVWPGLQSGYGGTTPSRFWRLTYLSAASVRDQRLFGGDQGPALPFGQYTGVSLLVVLGLGILWWRRDRRLWLFGAVGLCSVVLSLGRENRFWVPWRVLARIPVLYNVIPGRFTAAVLLCAAVMLGLILDHLHTAVLGRSPGRHSASAPRMGRRLAAGAAALSVAAVALVPPASALAGDVPVTTQSVVLPQWFARVAPRLPAGHVVLAYPAPFAGVQAAMAWQAVDRMHFAMAGGSSPEGIPERAGPERAGFTVIGDASLSFGPPPVPSPGHVLAVRRALEGWGVTTVVVPDQPELPAYDRGTDPGYALALFTAALGGVPRVQDRAWVWPDVRRSPPPLAVPEPAFDTCVRLGPALGPGTGAIPGCVVRAAR